MSTVARGQISFVDLNDGKTINLYLSSNKPLTQLYDVDADTSISSKYSPDYEASGNALVITPELFVSGSASASVDRVLTTPVWSIDGVDVDPSNPPTGVTVGTKAQGYILTIAKNMTNATRVITCTLIYTDAVTTVTTPAKASITFTKLDTAGEMIRAVMYAPLGTIFKKSTDGSINLQTLKLHCDMYRGTSIDSTNVSYEWYRHDNTQGRDTVAWVKITSSTAQGITGYTTNEITIPASAVLNYDVFKCVCTDTDTASSSSTPGATCTDMMSIFDMTDPYTVVFETPAGTTLNSGQVSTTTSVVLWQDGNKIDPETVSGAAFYNSCTFNWVKYTAAGLIDTSDKWSDASGTPDSNWDDGEASIAGSSGRTVTVYRGEIINTATYAVEIELV